MRDFEDTMPSQPMPLRPPRTGRHVPRPRGLGLFIAAWCAAFAAFFAMVFA